MPTLFRIFGFLLYLYVSQISLLFLLLIFCCVKMRFALRKKNQFLSSKRKNEIAIHKK